jgi:hypothetical protein
METLNNEQAQKLKNCVTELSNSMTRVEGEKAFQKDAIERAAEETGVDKKYIKRIAAIYHKQNYMEQKEESEEVMSIYEFISS